MNVKFNLRYGKRYTTPTDQEKHLGNHFTKECFEDTVISKQEILESINEALTFIEHNRDVTGCLHIKISVD